MKKGINRAALTVCLLWAFSGSANAALISGFNLLQTPDIFASFITVNYDGTGGLMIDGFLSTYDDGSGQQSASGDFNIDALLDTDGSLISGTLSAGSLLTGDLTDFGFSDGGGNIFEFLFTVSGGDVASDFGGIGATGGVSMGFVGFPGDWGSSFSGTGAVADVGVVPVPAALWLFGAGLVSLAGLRRRS